MYGVLEVGGEITAIKAQKRNRKRVNVYLDGEYAFSLKAIVAASLRQGEHLSDVGIAQLQMEDTVQEAHDRALSYLAYRPRSRSEMGHYLRRKAVPPQVIEEIQGRLSAAGLLDDAAFARYWVDNRETFRPRGRRLLRQELRQKGVDDELITETLSVVDEQQSAYRAALQQGTRYDRLDDDLYRQKMYSFLRRRGFEYEVIRETISSLLGQRSEEGAPGS